MSASQLKLATSDDAAPDTLAFERRTARRHPVNLRVTAVHRPTSPADPLNHICSLQLLNISDVGIAALAQEPLDPGALITLFFPPHGSEHGFDVYGHVVRCARRQDSYELGICLRQRAAA